MGDRPDAVTKGETMNAIFREVSPLPRLSAAAAARSGKVSVSIEMLLQWAYAQELVHGALGDGVPVILGGSGAPQLSAMADVAATRVSESRNYGFVAPRDAYLVNAAVLDLDDVELMLPRACLPAFDCARGYYRDETRRLTVEVPGGAVTIERRFVVHLRSLVQVWALRCGRPDWVQRPAITVDQGKAQYDTRKRMTMREVRFVGDMPWEVERARLGYRAWVGALAALQDVLAGKLSRFELTCALPAAMPWSGLVAAKT
jgi:hypothetical protein